jgi:hypothetical protein
MVDTYVYVRFDVSTAVTMKNGVFWDVVSCGSCKNRRFRERTASIIRVTRIGGIRTLAVTSNRRKKCVSYEVPTWFLSQKATSNLT